MPFTASGAQPLASLCNINARRRAGNVVADALGEVGILGCEDIRYALGLLEDPGVDLVLLDLTMPDADGVDGLSRLREAGPAKPIIVCSAQDDPALLRDCFKLGVENRMQAIIAVRERKK